MSMAGREFVVIGENIHATRVLLRKSDRIAANEEGEEGIVFVDEDGASAHLRIPEEEKLSQAYREGRIKHVRLAVQVAMAGTEPDCSTALSYLRTLAQRQVKGGAHFLDVNLDELSNKLADQLEAMRWLVRTLAPLVEIPLSIDSSNLEIIGTGLVAAAEAAGTRVRPADAQLGVARADRGARPGGATQGASRGYRRRRVGNAGEHRGTGGQRQPNG